MDIDPPNLCPNLKRSSSAPMINELVNTSSISSNTNQPRGNMSSMQRISRVIPARRFSGSFSPSRSPNSPTAPLSPLVLSRVVQIKHEESMDVVFREAVHERETKSKLQMSHSLEDLTLDEASLNEQNRQQRSQSIADPLRIHTPHAGICGSPSPTNTGRQCFSPSTCLPVQHSAFSSTPSPSPTRKSFTRCSQSPISLRPSQLSLKRKYDMDSDDGEFIPNAKHQNTAMSPIDSSPSSQHHVQNLSFNSMDTSCGSSMANDNQPNNIVGNVMSVCGNSFYGTFKHLDPAPTEGINK